ncbi:disulfide bond formation protein B [Methylorubrum podarium]|uniref:Disulfide bond formation protein B n=1 Tax=Methylorubrum podarium TaxID=200476 RepID=A0ABV1QJ16_9HYPH|nr:disulfide bond formation protein B [Methylorubrum podarium]MDV2986388.1 disulfide bond formation protein B [Methylobacteriaceae bacterium AG10]GJE69706.1 Disulfide bond formation protein B [Methylorubrum podarium]
MSRIPLRAAAVAVALGAALTVGGALVFEHGLGYVPCKLCLTERVPYYLAAPLALVAALLPPRPARFLLGLVAVVLIYGAGLGVYHAGAEWGFWPGPNDCGGGSGPGPADVADFLKNLETVRPVDCTAAAWRFLGLSLAGWNAVIAAGLGLLAAAAALVAQPSRGPHQPGR